MAQNSDRSAKGRGKRSRKAPPQNSPKRRRGPGRPFAKADPRINRGGRPKGLVAFIRENTRDGEELAERMLALLRGEVLVPDVKVVDKALVKVIQHAPHKDLIKAAEWLRDTTWGRPMQAVELTGKGGGPIETTQDLSGYTDDELKTLREVARARAARATQPRGDGSGAGAPAPAGVRDVAEPEVPAAAAPAAAGEDPPRDS